MRKIILIVVLISTYFQVNAQTEKVQFVRSTYECFYCKKTFTLPTLPNIKTVKNVKIKNSLEEQSQRTMMFVSSDVKNSGCMSNMNRSSKHDWRLSTSKKSTYTATMVKKEINDKMVEYADVPDWKTSDELFGE